MKLRNLLSTSLLTFALVASLTACGSDDGGETSETNATAAETTGDSTEEETGPDMEITCAIFCVEYIQSCLGTEFQTDAECQDACGMWDPDGRACRYQQMVDGMCAEAGTMGTACN